MRFRSASFLFLCLFATAMLSAQVAGTAAINGSVTDPAGAVVTGADVTVTALEGPTKRSVKTDATGRYIVTQLPPGLYKVEVTAASFKTAIRPSVQLPIGVTTTIEVKLELGEVTQSIVVTEAAVALNTTDASLGVPLIGTEVRALPTLDMNPAGLLSLQPGVAFIPAQADNPGGYGGATDYDGRSGAVNGARSDQTNITLDGVDCNDPITGYAFTCVLRATQASLAEFRTTTANYNPEAGGRSSSAQVQLLTSKGTNAYHGSAYYAHRNEALNANDFFLQKSGIAEPPFRRHIYGGSLGGPVWKDRFYMFGNYERMEESLFASALRTIPTPHVRDGVFIYACRNEAGFPNCPTTTTSVMGISGTAYTVPAGSYGLSPAEIAAIDPLGLGANPALLTYWGQYPTEINDTSVGDGVNFLGHRFAAPVSNTFNTYIARADFAVDANGNHTLYGRGTLQDDLINAEPQFAGQNSLRRTPIGNRGFAIGYTALLSSTLVNNFRFGITRIHLDNAGVLDAEYANVRFVDELHGFDSTRASTNTRRTPTYHFRDDVSWTRGKHSFSFGGEARYVRNQKSSNALSFHGFTVNPSWLNDGGRSIEPGQPNCAQAGCTAVPFNDAGRSFRDFLTLVLGPITQVDASYNFDKTGATLPDGAQVPRRFAANEYEVYFQDQWRLAPSLTITAGVRYLAASPPWEQNGNQVIPVPVDASLGGSISNWFNCRAEAMVAGDPTSDCGLVQTVLGGPENNGRGYYGRDNNNFSPRVAAAWSPRFTGGFLGALFGEGRTSIRGGYSLVYDRMGMALVNTFDQTGAFGMSTQITSLFGGCDIGPNGGLPACTRFNGPFDTAAPKTLIMPTGDPQLVPSPGAVFPATPPEGLLTVANGLDDTIRNPHAHVFDISISRELPGNLVFEAAYVGRRGRSLPLLRDYAMPADYCEPLSGVCATEASQQLVALSAAGQDINTLAPIAFWENLFPGFGPTGINGGCLQFEIFGVAGCGFSATQVAYDYLIGYHGLGASSGFGASTFWQDADYFAFPAYPSCASGTDLDADGFLDCPNTFFPAQWVNLFTWATIGRSEYHAMQLTARKRMSHGLSFALNYTLSKSLDHSSTPERQDIFGFFTGGYTGTAINSWKPDLEYGFSDFDMRHQFNGYWTYELPWGKGRRFGGDMPGWANTIVGGWQVSGILRLNSGVPANVINGRTWPTNWNLQGNATCAPAGVPAFGLDTGPCPSTENSHFATHTATGSVGPNIFGDPDTALTRFRFTAPWDRGQRNVLRADKYGSLDLGISKSFTMPYSESHNLTFRWEVFNLTNTPYFDAGSLSLNIEDPATFGDYTQMLGGPRRMQVTLRYEF